MQQTKTTENSALDDALIQCLRIFARHGRKVRAERLSGGVSQKFFEKESPSEKDLKTNTNNKSS
jgi:hypothetical protein